MGLALLAVEMGVSMAYNRWSGKRASYAALAPLMAASISVLMVRAGVLGAVRGGIKWRGTFYPKDLLKEGRRFRP